MAHSVSIRRSLLQSLVITIVLLGGTIMAITILGGRSGVQALSSDLIDRAVNEVDARLTGFFQPIVDELLVARAWGEAGAFSGTDPRTMNRLLSAMVAYHPQSSSMLLANDLGYEQMVLRQGSEWSSRRSHPDVWGTTTRWMYWTDEQPVPREEDRMVPYDARTRPWYVGAMQRRATALATPNATPEDFVFCTEPYRFHTTKELGITFATTFIDPSGRVHVIGYDLLLRDITAFTRHLRISEEGMVFVLTDDLRLIGLPAARAFDDQEARRAAWLKTPRELELDVAVDTADAIGTDAPPPDTPVLFTSGHRRWWGNVRPFALAGDRRLWITVVVPESDLLSDLRHLRLWILGAFVVALILATVHSVVLARRYSRPIEQLVRRSDLISRGDFRPRPAVDSRVQEVQQLAHAQERMRVGLESLMKLEGDLQLAREIQQRTFPDQLPDLPGFDLDAWACPAEETGGDTYDVVGLDAIDPMDTHYARAAFLLADATGHGIGPALSVTQIRAMMRMAARLGGGWREIAQHLNEQLYLDLPDHRFITAWMGVLDAASGSLTTFSAGQGPLLHYHYDEDHVEHRAADAPPFGVVPDLEIEVPPPIELRPGDVFAVISDGVFEAGAGHQEEQYGADRVAELMRRHRDGTATEFIADLRTSLERFTNGAPPGDDQTVVIIRRT